MPTPGATRSGKCDISSPSLAAFGPTRRPESRGAQLAQADEVALRQIELGQVGLEHHVLLRRRLLAEDGVPLRTVLVDLDQAGAADGQHDAPPVVRAQLGQQRGVHGDVRNAEVAREQLHMRQRVARAGRQDAGQRRQVGHRLGQHVDAVGAEGLHRLHVGRSACSTPRASPGLSALKPAPISLPSSLCCTPASRLASRDSVVERLRVEQQRAAAHLVLDEQLGLGLDLARAWPSPRRTACFRRLRAPARQQAGIAQRRQVVGQRHRLGAFRRESWPSSSRHCAARRSARCRRPRRCRRAAARSAVRRDGRAPAALAARRRR